jgi:hypothetical protein
MRVDFVDTVLRTGGVSRNAITWIGYIWNEDKGADWPFGYRARPFDRYAFLPDGCWSRNRPEAGACQHALLVRHQPDLQTVHHPLGPLFAENRSSHQPF